MTDEIMMQYAIAAAKKAATIDEVPIGAVVFHDGIVVGEGYNKKETTQDPTAHAEIIAITEASQQLQRWRLHEHSMPSSVSRK